MKKGQESAFPVVDQNRLHGFAPEYGLTKREYFAAMAMQGILAGRDPSGADPDMGWAVKIADELLKQLGE